jgi:hypothetical protein
LLDLLKYQHQHNNSCYPHNLGNTGWLPSDNILLDTIVGAQTMQAEMQVHGSS